MAVALLLALAAGSVGPAAEPVPEAVRARVAAELGEEGRPGVVPPGVIRPVDVDGDGRADWHVDYERESETAWCGTGGCFHQVYVGRADGSYTLAFSETARTMRFRAVAGDKGLRVDADVYGSYCGSAGAISCPRSFRWNAAEGRLLPVRAPGSDPRMFGPLFQPVVIERAAWPAAVAAVVAAREAACVAAGATLDEAASAVAVSPDLDGDGRSDWIVGSPWSSCAAPDSMPAAQADALPRPPLVVLAGEVPRVVLESPTGDYLVDIATTPATLMLMPDDEYRIFHCARRPTRCPGRVMRWDQAAGRLVEAPRPAAPPRSRAAPRTGRRPAR